MPPTPQPRTPRPLTIVVWESVPTRVSGKASPSLATTTCDKYSKLNWWQIPLPGGKTRIPLNADWAHFSREYRSEFLSYSLSRLTEKAASFPQAST